MTDQERIDRIQKAYDAATKGEWFSQCQPKGPCGSKVYGENIIGGTGYPRTEIVRRASVDCGSSQQTYDDCAFIALAHNEMPWLLEQARIVERLPKTEDDAVAYPNMPVWVFDEDVIRPTSIASMCVGCCVVATYGEVPWSGVFSTRAAAEAAKERA